MDGSNDRSLTDELVGGAISSIPLVGSVLAPLGERLSKLVREEHQRRTSYALQCAEQASGMQREELAETIEHDPQLLPLLTRLLYLVGMNGHDRVLGAMGAALGTAACNKHRIDEAELVLIAVTDLHPHHLLVLSRLVEREKSLAESERSRGLDPEQLSASLPLAPETVLLCLVTLLSRGLVEGGVSGELKWGSATPPSYRSRSVGRAVVEMLTTIGNR